jgi:hypothetical protein
MNINATNCRSTDLISAFKISHDTAKQLCVPSTSLKQLAVLFTNMALVSALIPGVFVKNRINQAIVQALA